MAVDTVVTGVQYSVFVPTNMQIRTVEGDILDHGWKFYPVQSPGGLRPERLVVLDRRGIDPLISFLVDVGLFFERFGYRVNVAHVITFIVLVMADILSVVSEVLIVPDQLSRSILYRYN
jgi:hypothetical protein